ncbi:MAG: LPXTG cell wall anchor domain-containing protein [Acidimicrobiia bacterium]
MGTNPKSRPDAGRGKILSTALLALALLASLVTFSPLADAGARGGHEGSGGKNECSVQVEQRMYKRPTTVTQHQYEKWVKGVFQEKSGWWWTTYDTFDWEDYPGAGPVWGQPSPSEGSHNAVLEEWETGSWWDKTYYRKITTEYKYVATGVTREVDGPPETTGYRSTPPDGDGWQPFGNAKTVNEPIDCPTASATPATCDAPGVITKSVSDYYTWHETVENGKTKVTATPAANVTFGNNVQRTWTFSIAKLTGKQCKTPVVPVTPTVNPATCDDPASLNLPQTPGINYTTSKQNGWTTVTASLQDSYKWGSDIPSGWNKKGRSYIWKTELDPKDSGQECAEKPEDTTRTDVIETLSCDAEKWTIVTTSYETPFVWSDAEGKYVPGEEVPVGEPVTTYREATYEELVEGGCTYLVQPSKTWDFGEGNSVPSDGEARITITAGELSKTWRFNTQGEMLGDEDTKAPLEVPMGTDYEVSETFTNPSGWSCEMVEMPVVPRAANVIEDVDVHNRCTIVTIPTIPEQPTTSTVPPTTSTTEEVGGIDEEPTTTTEAPTTTEPEVLDTVVTPTTVAKQTLPKTGSNTSTVLSLAGALLTAGAAFVLFGRRRFNASN